MEKLKKIVISQPMYFPWIGLLEQIRLADVFVYYEDVQFTKGFYHRVQIKTKMGWKWISVPLVNKKHKSKLNELSIDYEQNWQQQHLNLLNEAYRTAPFKNDALELVEEVFSFQDKKLSNLCKRSTHALVKYFRLDADIAFHNSTKVLTEYSSSERLLEFCKYYNADIYITGHGARNYLNHQLFEDKSIEVQYMKYNKNTYNQLHGDFNPFISALDLIANCGQTGLKYINSSAINWREFEIRKF